MPVILGGEKGSAVVALGLDSLDTVWKYQGSFSPSYYTVWTHGEDQSPDLKFRLVFFALKSCVRHIFSQLSIDQFGKFFVY